MAEKNTFLTIRELLSLPHMSNMKVIAGEAGLNREITYCYLLEYQFSPEMKTKYVYLYKQGSFVITTFMYAANNEYLITDAFRRLASQNASAVAIRNVFHLKIPDEALRLANTAKLPIILLDDVPENDVDSLIITVHDAIDAKASDAAQNRIADEILHSDLDEEELMNHVYRLFPNIGTHHRTDFFVPKEPISEAQWITISKIVRSAPAPYKSCCRYRDGFFLFHTLNEVNWNQIVDNTDPTIIDLRNLLPGCKTGISWIQHIPARLKYSMEEAYYTAEIIGERQYLRFGATGSFRMLVNARTDERMQEFSNDILDPIYAYDASRNGKLILTLRGLVSCEGNIHKLSVLLDQHENTIRQRMEKIEELTHLNYRNPDHYEQLSMAMKIRICLESLDNGEVPKIPIN